MTHFFEKRDVWGNRLSLWLVIIMAFATPVCWWSARELQLDDHLDSWLPRNEPEVQALQWAHRQFPIEERIVLTWDGSSLNDPRLEKLVEKLVGKTDIHGNKRGGLPYISSVTDPRQALAIMQDNGIEPQEAARRLEGTILGAGPLRVQLTETGRSALKKTKREIQKSARTRFGLELEIQDATPDLAPLVAIPAPIEAEGIPDEPHPPVIMSVTGELIEDSTVDHDLQVSWNGMRVGSSQTADVVNWMKSYVPERGEGMPLVENAFFVIGSPIALEIGISEAGLADKPETIAAIRSSCQSAGISPDTLHLSGSVITASEMTRETERSVSNSAFPWIQIHRHSVIFASGLAMALLAFLVLRSIRLGLLVVLVSSFTTLNVLAIVAATGGTWNMVLTVLPIILAMLTLSGSIHFANYWRQSPNCTEQQAIVQAFHRSWTPCLLASLTTAIGLFALGLSHLAPVRMFGLYAALGSLISFVLVVYGLPALLQLFPSPHWRGTEPDQTGWKYASKLLLFRPGIQSLALLLVCAALGLGLSRLQTEAKLFRNFPDQSRIARDYWFIENNIAGVIPVETIIRFDEQAQKEVSFLDRMELVRRIQDQMWLHPDISGSVSLADFQPVSEQPPEDASFFVRTKYQKRAILIEQRIRDGELAGARSFYHIADRAHDLYEPEDQRLNQPGDELWRITAQVNLMSDNDFGTVLTDLHAITQDVLKLQPGSNHQITGDAALVVLTQQAIQQSFFGSLALTAALIFVVFSFLFRSIPAALIAMIPNVLPAITVLGALSWMQQRIDLGIMLTAAVSLGLAVDGTLHFLLWYRSALGNGKSRQEAVTDSLVHVGPAIWQAGFVMALGLAVLLPAELRMISRFGGVLAAMIAVSVFGDLVLLPQLLSGPLGWIFEPKTRQPATQSILPPAEPSLEPVETGVAQVAAIPRPHHKPIDPSRRKGRPTA